MIITGLKRLSSETIEDKAKTLLLYFRNDYFSRVQATPLLEIADFLHHKHNVIFNFKSILGFNSSNYRVLGACNPTKRVILIDSAIYDQAHKFNFTLAHELGHLALHRNLKFKYEENDIIETDDAFDERWTTKKELKTDTDWMEWQANYYATSLLMPSNLFRQAFIASQDRLGISKTDKLLLNNQRTNQKDYFRIVRMLSEQFDVSKSVIEYRLKKLELTNDERSSSSW